MSNITAVYLTGKHLAMKENLVITGVSLFIWILGSLFLYIASFESVQNNNESKILIIFVLIILLLLSWALSLIVSLALNNYSLDLYGVIKHAKSIFGALVAGSISYLLIRFKIIFNSK